MSFDAHALGAAVAAHGAVVRIVVTRTAGSVPRPEGTAMLVWADGQDGTIGGGALEFSAIAEARAVLRDGVEAEVAAVPGVLLRMRTLPLGPGLGQCCGGAVTLVWELFAAHSLPRDFPFMRPVAEHVAGPGAEPVAKHGGHSAPPPRVIARAAALGPGCGPVEADGWLIETALAPARPLWIFGAGHVGRALVSVLAPLPGHAITWIDTGAERFPDTVPDGVTPVVASQPAALVRHAPRDADHLILTYAHDMDLAICHALLTRGFASAGLIGSATKWARFRTRLAALGHPPARIARIACPIGDPQLGKHPQAIAIGVAAAILGSRGMIKTQGERAG